MGIGWGALEKLTSLRARIAQVTREADTNLRDFESIIVASGFEIEANVKCKDSCLGWGRVPGSQSTWGLIVGVNSGHWNDVVWGTVFAQEPRIRLEAVQRLDSLLDEMLTTAEDTAAEAEGYLEYVERELRNIVTQAERAKKKPRRKTKAAKARRKKS